MAEHAQHAEHSGHHPNYRNIYFTLLALLVVSVVGPMFEILWLTLATAFGIALIKAALVVQNFMHLKWERALIGWVLASALLLMFLMFAGVAPDVMSHEGANWENMAAREVIERGIPLPVEEGAEGAVVH
jgi:caa(3)-type oxidase subunit IV